MRCPECGNDNREGARFCDSCGASLAPVTAPGTQAESEASSEPGPPPPLPGGISAPPGDAPESVGDGRFEVVGFLGEGSRKRVYLARDAEESGRLVAVSVFNTEDLAATAQARARREAEAMEQLGDNRHVVAVLASGQDGDRPFIVSTFVEGGDLNDLLDSAPGRRLAVARALEITADVAAGLEHAHARGIIHRDIKPANIWLDSDGAARVGDFGLAVNAARSREAVERMVVGTAAYLPPEQAIGRRTDARADLYSLGALLFEMLAGEPPFPGDDPVSIISRHLSAEPLPPSHHNPEVPAGVDDLVRTLLAKSPGDRPGGASELRREIERLAAEPAGEVAEAPENPLDSLAGGIFVGREPELEALRELTENAIGGRGGVALIEGEPGIGKTRLVEELITYARVRGATVLTSSCHEADAVPAYWPFAQVIRSYIRDADPVGLAWQLGSDGPEIARLVPELRERVPSIAAPPPIEGDEARFRFYEAVTELLCGIAASRPLVLIFDDLHWADSSSVELLRFLARKLTGNALLLVCAYRDEEAATRDNLKQALAELDEVAGRRHLALKGLNREAIERFLQLTTGEPPAASVLDQIHDQTGGNPFFVSEVVRLLVTDGGTGNVGRGTVLVPEGVRDAVSRRLGRLPDEVNAALEAAAVLGREFDLELLAQLVEGDVRDLLEAALAARITERRPGSERWLFAHAVFREALYENLRPERRAELHLRAAKAIEALHAEHLDRQLQALARHYVAAGSAGEPARAFGYSLSAGRDAASKLAHADAAEYLERALELLPEEERPQEIPLRLELAEEMTRSGRFHDARRVLFATAELARERGDIGSLVEIGIAISALSEVGSIDSELVAVLEEGLAAIPADDKARRSLLLTALAQEYYWADAEGASTDAAREALGLARESGDDRALAAALGPAQILDAATPGFAESRLATADELLEVARRTRETTFEARAHANRLVCFLQLGRVDGAERALADYTALVNRLGEPRHLWHVPIMRATLETIKGNFSLARELSDEGARLGKIAQEPLSIQFNTLQLALLHMYQGTAEEMLPRIRRMVETYPAIPAWRLSLVGFLNEAGRVDEARAEFEPIAAAGFDGIPRDANWLVGMARITEVAAALGDVQSCRTLTGLLADFAGEHVVVGRAAAYAGPTDHYLGLGSLAIGEPDLAIGHLERAIAAADRVGEKPIRANSRLHIGRALLLRDGPGDRDRALEALSKALEEGQELGMRRLVERTVRDRLEAQGVAGVDANASIDSVALAVADERPDLGSIASADGRVSILFSDIKNSTLMTEALGDERWIGVLRAHNALFRGRLAEFNGYEVKNQGDGFMLAFPDPGLALGCAVAVQRDLAGAGDGPDGVKVRMGLHVGEVIEEEGDFFGRSVVLAARIAAQARGGEILTSEALRSACGGSEFGWDEGRELELKGLAGSHRVFAVNWRTETTGALA